MYLDHAGTTPYPRSLVVDFATAMNSNIFGNPHSHSPSSMLSTDVIELTRLQALTFFKADPEHFDLIFVANATAAIKLVMECVSNHSRRASSWYSYHADSHTSLVGVRETAGGSSRCFKSDKEVDSWINCRRLQKSQEPSTEVGVNLFAYPAQSNMNGRRLPLSWPGGVRASNRPSSQVFTLLDAAAYVATTQLDLSDPDNAPDFTALSFYKIFGFPDAGALIVRKASGRALSERRYFGGGTVDMVINRTDNGNVSDAWHAKKSGSLHEMLEDGTPASHSILALNLALKVHQKLFGSMENVSKHTCNLATILHEKMSKLCHANGLLVCKIYEAFPSKYGTTEDQGPVIAFNVRSSRGEWIGKSHFERLATLNNVQLRTGGVCNPGGIASALDMSPSEMRDNFDKGLRCGNELDEINGKPTGIVRVSLGAMSSIDDIEKFMVFMQLFTDTSSKKLKSLPSLESVGSTETVPLPGMVLRCEPKAAVSVKDSTANPTCPVAACMKSFETRESLWSHLAVHCISNAGRKSTPTTRSCLGMRR
ncbi:hypothetical protein IMSHALPRED_006873 [Imshaugia aleurites]|uniref:C2H2-type domain-containing protein n=1 Tax=Imshaugia aleurites TaxID=172621 RepID=A0A8H3FJA4_9LECA|nr:hypothetical protein IMSHALPRED_006873 [Imshaugia aleurites]